MEGSEMADPDLALMPAASLDQSHQTQTIMEDVENPGRSATAFDVMRIQMDIAEQEQSKSCTANKLLETQLRELKTRFEKSEESLQDARGLHKFVLDVRARLEGRIEELKQELSDLKDVNKITTEMNSQLLDRNTSHVSDYNELKEENQRLQTSSELAATDLERTKVAADEQLSTVRKDLHAAKTDLLLRSAQTSAREKELLESKEGLKKTLLKEQEETKNAKSDLREVRAANDQQEALLRSKQAAWDEKKAELSADKREQMEALADLRGQVDALAKSLNQAQSKVTTLEADKVQSTSDIDALKQKLHEYEKVSAEEMVNTTAAMEEAAQLRSLLDTTQRSLAEEKGKVAELQPVATCIEAMMKQRESSSLDVLRSSGGSVTLSDASDTPTEPVIPDQPSDDGVRIGDKHHIETEPGSETPSKRQKRSNGIADRDVPECRGLDSSWRRFYKDSSEYALHPTLSGALNSGKLTVEYLLSYAPMPSIQSEPKKHLAPIEASFDHAYTYIAKVPTGHPLARIRRILFMMVIERIMRSKLDACHIGNREVVEKAVRQWLPGWFKGMADDDVQNVVCNLVRWGHSGWKILQFCTRFGYGSIFHLEDCLTDAFLEQQWEKTPSREAAMEYFGEVVGFAAMVDTRLNALAENVLDQMAAPFLAGL